VPEEKKQWKKLQVAQGKVEILTLQIVTDWPLITNQNNFI
jgi:hypothetical protein